MYNFNMFYFSFPIQASGVEVNNGNVIAADISATNGVVHKVDKVRCTKFKKNLAII